MVAVNELPLSVSTAPLVLVLIESMVTLLHLMWVYSMEEELTGEAMGPVGLPLVTVGELHMMVMTCSMMSSQILVKSLKVWEIMNHTHQLIVVLILVTMVDIMTIVREKNVTA